MAEAPIVLWLNTSPAFSGFHRPLLKLLTRQAVVLQWDYQRSLDEADSLDQAVVLLHDYLKARSHPIHVVGHSTSGLVGLLYARQYPERVKSLTLLSVGMHPAVNWHAHYYAHRRLLRCSRHIILSQMVNTLFGKQPYSMHCRLHNILDRDLTQSLSPHCLLQKATVATGGIQKPLLICGAQDDDIVDPVQVQGWQEWLKPEDRLWLCPSGRHFFHYAHPQLVSDRLLSFWRQTQVTATALSPFY